MKTKMLSGTYGIQINFHSQIANVLVVSSLIILALSEVAINNDDLDYWNIDERLNKHRTVRDYDIHVQKMLLSLKKVGSLNATLVNTGINNYHFVEFNDAISGICIRVLHTFNPKAKYMKKYLAMNSNPNAPRFAYIQYSLDNTKSKVRKLKVVIPGADGNVYSSIDLFQQFCAIKQNLGQIQRNSINKMLCLLQTETNAAAQIKEINE